MLIESHWMDGRFAKDITYCMDHAIEVARGRVRGGAVLSNILNNQDALVATVDADNDDVVYHEEL